MFVSHSLLLLIIEQYMYVEILCSHLYVSVQISKLIHGRKCLDPSPAVIREEIHRAGYIRH